MKCPECGGAELERGKRDLRYTYGAATTLIENVAGEWCPVCGGGVIDYDEEERLDDRCLSFNKQASATRLTTESRSRSTAVRGR